jgi:hypothetical protein
MLRIEVGLGIDWPAIFFQPNLHQELPPTIVSQEALVGVCQHALSTGHPSTNNTQAVLRRLVKQKK